jgi:hypothetical protein
VKSTVHTDTGSYTFKPVGPLSVTYKDGGTERPVSGWLSKVTERRAGYKYRTYLALTTDGLDPGEYQLGNMHVHVLPRDKWDPPGRVRPTWDMSTLYGRPAKGLVTTAASAAPGIYALATGSPLVPALLMGASFPLFLGFLGFLPYAASRAYGAYKGRKAAKAAGEPYVGDKRRMAREKAPGLVKYLEDQVYGQYNGPSTTAAGTSAAAAEA